MPILDVSSEPILDLCDSLYALFPESHDDPRSPKRRNHEGSKDDQEEQRQWLKCIKNSLECIKNSYAIAKEWMDKDKALWVESKLGLDSNGEFNSIPFANMTHPSLE